MNPQTREGIVQAIAEGKFGIARDRLYDVLRNIPNDWEARSMLGGINHTLGYEEEAGRLWFFDDPMTAEKQAAVDLFVKRCNGQPDVILRRLRIQFDPAVMPRNQAEDKIKELVADCDKRGVTAPYIPPGEKRARPEIEKRERTLQAFTVTCGILTATIGFLALVGLFALFDCGPPK